MRRSEGGHRDAGRNVQVHAERALRKASRHASAQARSRSVHPRLGRHHPRDGSQSRDPRAPRASPQAARIKARRTCRRMDSRRFNGRDSRHLLSTSQSMAIRSHQERTQASRTDARLSVRTRIRNGMRLFCAPRLNVQRTSCVFLPRPRFLQQNSKSRGRASERGLTRPDAPPA